VYSSCGPDRPDGGRCHRTGQGHAGHAFFCKVEKVPRLSVTEHATDAPKRKSGATPPHRAGSRTRSFGLAGIILNPIPTLVSPISCPI
jgi:hypothetical protein